MLWVMANCQASKKLTSHVTKRRVRSRQNKLLSDTWHLRGDRRELWPGQQEEMVPGYPDVVSGSLVGH